MSAIFFLKLNNYKVLDNFQEIVSLLSGSPIMFFLGSIYLILPHSIVRLILVKFLKIKLNFLDGSKKTNSLIYSDCMIYTSSGQFDSQGRMVRPGMAFVNEDIGTYDISCRKLESVSGRQVVNDRDKFINGLSFHGYAPDFEKKAFVSLNEKPVGAADISVSFSMIDSERQMTMYADFRIGYFGAGAALCDSGTR